MPALIIFPEDNSKDVIKRSLESFWAPCGVATETRGSPWAAASSPADACSPAPSAPLLCMPTTTAPPPTHNLRTGAGGDRKHFGTVFKVSEGNNNSDLVCRINGRLQMITQNLPLNTELCKRALSPWAKPEHEIAPFARMICKVSPHHFLYLLVNLVLYSPGKCWG